MIGDTLRRIPVSSCGSVACPSYTATRDYTTGLPKFLDLNNDRVER